MTVSLMHDYFEKCPFNVIYLQCNAFLIQSLHSLNKYKVLLGRYTKLHIMKKKEQKFLKGFLLKSTD